MGKKARNAGKKASVPSSGRLADSSSVSPAGKFKKVKMSRMEAEIAASKGLVASKPIHSGSRGFGVSLGFGTYAWSG